MVYRAKQSRFTDHRETLASVPTLVDTARLVERTEDTVTLKVSVERGHGFFDRFRPPVIEKKYELDELGTFIVKQINGRNSIMGLTDAFAARYKVNRREAELSVVSFVKMLAQRQVIVVAAME